MTQSDTDPRLEHIKNLIIANVPGISHNKPQDLAVSVLAGGITNTLYRVKAPLDPSYSSTDSKRKEEEDETTTNTLSLVVRVFGEGTEHIISRDNEFFWQSQHLKTYVKQDGCLVYEFLEGYHPLDYPELSSHADAIAAAIAAFHDSSTRAGLFTFPFNAEENHTQLTMRDWTNQVLDVKEVRSKIPAERLHVYEDLQWEKNLRNDVAYILSVIEEHKQELPEAICHNDLLSGNIMVHHKTGETRFIDFEYCRKNYVFFDIANHFNEYPGFECDYNKYFPSREHISNFLSTYFISGQRKTQVATTRAPLCDVQLSRATDLVLFFTTVSNLHWAIWSLIQALYSSIDFDYLDYARVRYQRFLETKDLFKPPPPNK